MVETNPTKLSAEAALEQAEQLANEIARRAALAREPNLDQAKGPSIWRWLGEAEALGAPFRRDLRQIEVQPSANPRMVMMLPGFGTGPTRMRFLARQIERAGHKVKRWGMGLNFGPSEANFAQLEERLSEIYHRYGDQKVYLVGWSLGGLFARELAKSHPDMVAKTITMGTPFSGSMRANNVWRIYQAVAGHSVDSPPVVEDLGAKPPVPTVAFWSPRDGMVAPRSASGQPDERDKAVALRCTHIGFSYAPEAVQAILTELELGEDL